MKKIFFVTIVCLFFGTVPYVFAQGFVPLAPIPGLTDTNALSVANSTNLASFFNNLYKYLIGLAAVLAVIEIIWGGLEYSTQDSISKKSDGKARITQAILGLILVLSPVLVFSIINPSILNLSLNLQPLDTAAKPAPVTSKNASGQVSTPTMNTNLTVLSIAFYGPKATDGYLKESTKKVVPNGASQLETFKAQCTAKGKMITIQLQARDVCLPSYGITDTSSGIVCAVYNVNCQ